MGRAGACSSTANASAAGERRSDREDKVLTALYTQLSGAEPVVPEPEKPADGVSRKDGRLPVNPSGGLKSRGHRSVYTIDKPEHFHLMSMEDQLSFMMTAMKKAAAFSK